MPVAFEDYHIQVEDALNDGVIRGLIEAAVEVTSAASDISRVDQGHLRGSWKYTVDEEALEATVGSPLENAIWEEFGTGEYSIEGSHGGGYWVFVKNGDGGNNSGGGKKLGKRYSLKKAKQIVAMMRANGLDAYYTKGKKPNRTLWKAFNSKKNIIKRLIEHAIKDAMK